MASTTLPTTMKALVCEEAGKPLQLKTLPVPTATPGSVVVKILVTAADPGLAHILSGRVFTFPKNLVPCGRAVGRVAAIGPDTTSLTEGQLVLIEPFVRARDDPNVQILWGTFDGPTPASKKFTADNWSRGTLAEYCRTPLENCHPLNEKLLCGSPSEGGFGYRPEDLLALSKQVVAYGGLRGIHLEPGETVIVAPATGMFSGAAVQVAVAMGAKVIAFSRNKAVLEQIQATQPAGRVEIVLNTGDVEKDTAALKQFGPVDAYIDISPFQAAKSTHVRSAIMAVRQYGRVSLMGVIPGDISVPYAYAMWNNLTIRGQYMYERDDVRSLIKLAEAGVLPLGEKSGVKVIGKFGLDEFGQAIELASSHPEIGSTVVFTP
ncbi:GroES-like protein [Coniochaeta ligniaria NRRL 30616]|uniref:GroES-like protein n=1 Tax=Coniochaeta ligniaria NRRL 30616 TaxID=1408157 RepID=A0A1J7IZG1_9PEZI|nr:GroES-like protein [Coniochaeta ligniaria NRRL 30616]